MAKCLNFSLGGVVHSATPVKVDRKKLYGWSETKAFDEDGHECTLASTDESGSVIIPKGGAGLGIVSPDMQWVERSSLKAVKNDGSDAELLESSYDIRITLNRTVSAEEFLNHRITAVYQLDTDPIFAKAIGDTIYTFTYNYRAAYEGSPAFLLVSGGQPFMLTGCECDFEMLSLKESGAIDSDDDEIEDDDDSDTDIDFSMF